MATSQNGYRANTESLISSRRIPGTTRKIRLRKGPAGDLLLAFAGEFDKAVEDIEAGQLDDWGYAERPIRGSTTTLSNHASGTAIDLNATRHPLGKRGTFSRSQVNAIRLLLVKYGGCIRWGGDYVRRADEMHFEIVEDEATCARTLARFNTKEEVDDMTPQQEAKLDALVKAVTEQGRDIEWLKGRVGGTGDAANVTNALRQIDAKVSALPLPEAP